MSLEGIVNKIASEVKIASMSESEFWKIIEDIGWGKKTLDYNKIKEGLKKSWNRTTCVDFRHLLDKAFHRLYKVIEEWEDEDRKNRYLGLGDDGFGDLLNHIIGLGKKEYDSVIKNPKLAWNRAKENKFKESFDYCIPYPKDFKDERDLSSFKAAVIKVKEETAKIADKWYEMSKLAESFNEYNAADGFKNIGDKLKQFGEVSEWYRR